MNIELELSSNESSEKDVLSLQDWIKKEQVSDLQVKRKADIPKEDDMGFDLLAILEIAVSSGLVTELVKSVIGWIQVRGSSKKMRVKINCGEHEMVIESDNLSNVQALLEDFRLNCK